MYKKAKGRKYKTHHIAEVYKKAKGRKHTRHHIAEVCKKAKGRKYKTHHIAEVYEKDKGRKYKTYHIAEVYKKAKGRKYKTHHIAEVYKKELQRCPNLRQSQNSHAHYRSASQTTSGHLTTIVHLHIWNASLHIWNVISIPSQQQGILSMTVLSGRSGLVVRSRPRDRRVAGSKPDSAEDPPCVGPVAR
ncbi:hypothetical protein AVEN_262810-1 [Araneus ventricosus]|uniref:Uncharacterized protein n=1 Tax=Araneus ventricosus TaxID=182803 RepID=A0A4Y2THH1_ARAVE|nr:hypothetical protein AVEN_262810-1 [Araneus ventricosus]